jgi:hypothetical protein
MCYSGKCIWEQSSGDCGFPTVKIVRDKYPLPLCSIPDDEELTEEFWNMVEDAKKLAKISTTKFIGK